MATIPSSEQQLTTRLYLIRYTASLITADFLRQETK
jgi:hypothetical protein